MGIKYSMYFFDDKKRQTIPYDEEMQKYIELQFV